jgi:hypothetical protein
MDNTAPGLNFVLGNLVGMSELDVASVEILPGLHLHFMVLVLSMVSYS